MNLMTERKRQFIAYEAYEKLADAYAEQVGTMPHNAYLERPATLSLLPDVKGKNVLDAGCGPGNLAEWLLDQGATVKGVDASPKMVAHAQCRVGDRADIRLHDLRDKMEFIEDDSLARAVMDYIENWVPVFKEFRRVMKPDGCLVFSVGHPAIDYVIKKNVDDYFQIEKVEMTWSTWGEPVMMPSYRRPIMNMTESLHQAGFLIERFIEARPTEDYMKADPEGYEVVSKRPSFINIKVVPKK
jgi:SAM-dependent methyltransferase